MGRPRAREFPLIDPSFLVMTDVEALKASGNTAFREARYLEAIDCFTQALALDPSNETLLSNRAGSYAAAGRFNASLSDAEKVIGINPGWAKGHSRHGAALYGLGRLSDSLAAYEKALSLEPANGQVVQAISDIKTKLEQQQQQQQQPSSQPPQPSPASAEGSASSKAGTAFSSFFDSARNATKNFAEKSRATVQQTMQKAREEHAKHREQKNEERCRIMPQEVADHNVAIALQAAEDAEFEAAAREEGMRVAAEADSKVAEEAAAAAQAARDGNNVSDPPSYVQHHKQLGNEALKAARFEEASAHYSKALEVAVDAGMEEAAVLFSNRSGALAASGSYDLALADAERCIALRPDWAKGHGRKATALHGLKQYLQAIASFDDALQHQPGDETLLLGRRQASFELAMEPDL